VRNGEVEKGGKDVGMRDGARGEMDQTSPFGFGAGKKVTSRGVDGEC